MRLAAAAILACALATAASGREPRRLPAVQRIGRLMVSVESVTRPSRHGTELAVTLHASALASNERARVERATLIDVRGRRFEALREGMPKEIRPGTVTFRFAVPDDAGIVTLEIDGRSFEVAHVNRLIDVPAALK